METKLGAKIVKLTLGTYVIKTHLLNVVCAGMASGKSMNSVIMAIKLAAEIVYSRLAIHVLGLKTVPQFAVSYHFAGTRSSRWESSVIMATKKDVPRTVRLIQATVAQQS